VKKRRWVKVLVVLAVVVAAGLLAVSRVLDRAAAAALTRGVTYAGEVPCEVRKVGLSLVGGRVEVSELAVGNPPGYAEADMFRLERADVQVRIGSLLRGPVHVRNLEIIKPRIRIEAGPGGSNVKVFLATVARNVGASEPKEEAEPTRLIVDRLVIRDATIEIGMGISPRGVPITLQTVELGPVRGENGEGVTAGELASVIVAQLVEKGVVQVGLDADLEKVLPQGAADRVAKEIEATGKAAGKAVEKVRGTLEELLKPKNPQ